MAKKPRIVAIDTSSKVLALALAEGEQVLWASNTADQFRHIEELVPRIETGLTALEWGMEDITHIICGVGPGSFTGLRVGLATVKGLAAACGQHIVTCSSLDVIAQNVSGERVVPMLKQSSLCCGTARGNHSFPMIASGSVCKVGMVLVDARRDKMYTARYAARGSRWVRVGKERVETIDEVCAVIHKQKSPVWVSGDALRVYGETLTKRVGENVQVMPDVYWYPEARNIVACGYADVCRKNYTEIPALVPHYLRLSEAEEQQKLRKGKKRS